MSAAASAWRLRGEPLVAATRPGPLTGESVAVKDVYAVAGHATGAGNPAWLEAAPVATAHAWPVERLLGAGADVVGLAHTDELAYSLAGANAHHGTPPNPAAPDRISGGSSSGSAAAVALGEASVGLGTDTAGSIRVPAAYQGLWGVRTTHGAVPRDGVLPLAPSFDAVGWLARDATTLRRVGEALLPPDDHGPLGTEDLVVVPALLDLAEPDVCAALAPRVDGLPRLDWLPVELGDWLAAFQVLQAWEAWQCHGSWVAEHRETLGPDVRGRFDRAAGVTAEEAEAARATVLAARSAVRELVGDRVLVLPSASSVAPPRGDGLAERLQQVRDATMRLTCLAGLGGLPAVGVPVTTPAGLPTGACLVGPAGSDHALLGLAARLGWEDRP